MKWTSAVWVVLLWVAGAPVTGHAGEVRHTVEVGPYRFERTPEGQDRIRAEGFVDHLVPGAPRLPVRVVEVPLPPGARAVRLLVDDLRSSDLPGRYSIEPAAPMSPSDGDPDGAEACLERWAATREAVYGGDDPWPGEPLELLGTSARGRETAARVRFSPFAWRPRSGRLTLLESVSFRVVYELDPARVPPAAKGGASTREDLSPYVIVTTDSLASAVDTLVAWKRYVGIDTRVVTDSWIESTYSGDDLQEKIRAFLIDRYVPWDIHWVLLVGDTADIPMRVCYPMAGSPYIKVPTDHYYADLTGDWDSDGDGLPGEYGEDDVDFVAEVAVGRLPFGDPERVRGACETILSFEADTTSWKDDALLAGSILNFRNEGMPGRPRTDGAELAEELRSDLLSGLSRRLYEKAGLEPCPYACERPLTWTGFLNEWQTREFGMVSWVSHGTYEKALRKRWEWDDGDGIPENPELVSTYFLRTSDGPTLAGARPGIVFACACSNGDVEKDDLASALLGRSAASIVAATRVVYYSNGWDDESDGGMASIDYYFFDELLGGSTVGDALFASKETYLDDFFWWEESSQQMLLAFSLYGDPALRREGIGDLIPTRTAASPAPEETDVAVGADVTLSFSRPIRASTLAGATWAVFGQASGPHAGAFSYDPGARTALFDPDRDFAPGEAVTVVLTDGVLSTMGWPLDAPSVWTFFAESRGGPGSFGAAPSLEIPGAPSAVTAADFDGDGRPDLAVGNGSNGHVSVFLNGAGTGFGPHVDYPVGGRPSALAAGDLTGDGAPDLAVLVGAELRILRNDGAGGFVSHSGVPLPDSGAALVLGEMNGDVHLDVAVAGATLDSLWILTNAGDSLEVSLGLWTGPSPRALAVADLDGNGRTDVVSSLGGSDSLVLFLNVSGLPGVRTAVPLGFPGGAVRAGDFDGSGRTDLAVLDPAGDRLCVLLGAGGGQFSADSTYEVGGGPCDLAVTDFDGDGDLDLLTADAGWSGVSLLVNAGGTFHVDALPTQAPSLAAAAADFDGDLRVDVVLAAARADSNLLVLLNLEDVTGTADPGTDLPCALHLFPNVPNPFNPVTEIRFDLPVAQEVVVTIYDVQGRVVRNLVDGSLEGGAHRVLWDGEDEDGLGVPSGVYFLRLEAGGDVRTRKMILLR